MKWIYYIAACDYCEWVSGQCSTIAEAQKEAKQHLNDNPHRDYSDDPIF